jgi:HlyD family secretion protein
MKKLASIVVAVALAAGGYYGYTRWGQTEQTLQLVTAAASRGDVVQSIDATGRLEAVTTVQVGSQVSGTIKTLYADFNSRVRRGQVIAELEPSLFQTQVEQAEATVVRLQAEVDRARVQYDDAQVKLARARDLAAKELLAATDLDTAETNAKAADAALKAAQAQVVQARASLNQSKVNLSHTVITAPIDGVVISRNVDVGQTVAASMQAPTLFQIANDLTRMQVNANIDESDIGQVAAGQPVTFQVDAFPNQTFAGTVSQVRLNPVIESNVVSYVTVIDVPNRDLKLRPGMTATVTVEVARAPQVLRVPASALRFAPTAELFAALGQTVPDAASFEPNGASGRGIPPGVREGGPQGTRGRVWAVIDGQLKPVPVRTGISDGVNVAVLDGALQDGMLVATGTIQGSTAATAPTTTTNPLLPQFPRRGGAGGPAGGGARGQGGNQGGSGRAGP